MADTPDGTGLSLEQAAASLLTGGADTQKEESQESEPVAAADDPASTDEPVAEATDEPAEPSTDEDASDESEAAEPAEPVKFRFKLSDGTEVEATPDELSKSYLRQADYTRKTQEIANQRKALEQEAAALREQRAQEIQTLQVAQQVLRQHVPPPPDPAMAQTDPVGYVQAMAAHNAAMQQYQKIAQQQQAVAEQSQAEQAMMLQQHLASEAAALIERIPDWKDGAKAKAEKAALIEYGKQSGYTDAELAQVYDSRAVAIMRKAMLYDKLMAQKPAIEAKAAAAPKFVSPGVSQSGQSKVTEAARLKQRLAKTGSVDDAAALLMMG